MLKKFGMFLPLVLNYKYLIQIFKKYRLILYEKCCIMNIRDTHEQLNKNITEYSSNHICLEIWTKRFYQVTVKYLTMGGYKNYNEIIIN